MKIEQIYTGCLAQGAYFIQSENEAVVIDPLREVQPYLDRAEKEGVKIKYVFETHFHADFVSGHIDLANAMSLGLSVQLIQDGKANFLYYSRDKCLAGTELFSQYVDTLFKLKESKIKRAKSILNILWGALGEYDKKKMHVGHNKKGKQGKHKTDHKIVGLRPYNDSETTIETVNNNVQYKTGFARLKPFIISRGRANIAKIMLPYHRTVMRCHTDGFICSEKPIGLKTGTELGDLVDEDMKTKIQIDSCRKPKILK